jgi:hypothetical protein
MECLFFHLLFLLPVVSEGANQPYFPPHALSEDQQRDDSLIAWYSKHLKALEEPSLWEFSKTSKTQTYRFVWLRTFHHPIAVRLNVKEDGTSLLTLKQTSGGGGYEPEKLTLNESRVISKDQTQWFLERIDTFKYWDIPSEEMYGGCDGAQWVIEGVRDGKYKVIDRWSPKEGPVRTLGLIMVVGLAKMKIPSDEIY